MQLPTWQELAAWQRYLVGAAGLVLFLGLTLLLFWAAAGSRQITPGPIESVPVNAEEASWRLAEAIRFRTISPQDPAGFDGNTFIAFHDFLADSYPRVHTALAREVIDEYSLLYTWDGSEPSLPGILLIGHLDVVPLDVGTELKWTHPAFDGVIDDGRIWGRGALDAKASIIAMLDAVETLLALGFSPRRTVYLAFGYDKETGGEFGAAKIANLLRTRNVKLQFSLDEGLAISENLIQGLSKPAALVGLSEKGQLTLRLSARGREGSASTPPEHTSLGLVARAITRLERHPLAPSFAGPVAEMYAFLAPEMDFPEGIMFNNLWLFKSSIIEKMAASPATNAMLRTTIAATMANAGVKSSVLPSEARAVLDIRLMPGDTMSDLLRHAREVIADPLVQVEQVAGNNPGPVSASDSDGFRAVHRTIRQVFANVVVAPGLVIGATDSRHFQDLTDDSYRFLPVRLGPADLKRIHGSDERISVQGLVDMIRFYAQLLRNAAG